VKFSRGRGGGVPEIAIFDDFGKVGKEGGRGGYFSCFLRFSNVSRSEKVSKSAIFWRSMGGTGSPRGFPGKRVIFNHFALRTFPTKAEMG